MAPSFISDLIPLILESNDYWWPQDLLRLAQVSHAWLQPTQRLLYARPILYTFSASSQFARALSGNPSLRHLVKGIDLRPVSRYTGESSASLTDLKYILGIEKLQTITLGGHLAVRTERFLNIIHDPGSVTNLHIDGSWLACSSCHRPSLEWDESIAYKFTSLQSLRLTSIELEIIFPSTPYQFYLSELVLENIDILDGYLCHLYNAPSLPRLCVRSESFTDLGDHVGLLLSSCALQRLEYEVQGSPSYIPFFDMDTPYFGSLSYLHLDGAPVDLGLLALIGQRCHKLEELVITGQLVMIMPMEWVEFIRARPVSSLRTLGLPWGTSYPPFQRWDNAANDTILQAGVSHGMEIVNNLKVRSPRVHLL